MIILDGIESFDYFVEIWVFVFRDNPWWNWKTFLPIIRISQIMKIILDGIESELLIYELKILRHHGDNPWWNWKLFYDISSRQSLYNDNPWWNWKRIQAKSKDILSKVIILYGIESSSRLVDLLHYYLVIVLNRMKVFSISHN